MGEIEMAKSVRLTSEMQKRLERAAHAAGVSQSELIREAVERRCDEVLGKSLAERLANVTGIIESSGGRARRTGESFKRVLRKRREAC